MKKFLHYTISLSFLIIGSSTFSQVFYTEDFDGAITWTINTDLGAEGSSPNVWYISCQEEGVGAGACGASCGAGNKTLHVGTGVFGDLGASYYEAADGSTTTERRAESADISTVGETSITLDFDLIGWGGEVNDYCELFYSIDGGGTWTSLASPVGSLCCGGVPCGGGLQGLWQTNTYALPAACEGITNLRISFVWKNLDNGTATDPSFAVDNLTLTSGGAPPPTVWANFSPSRPEICVGDCITVADASTGSITGWAWTFSDVSMSPLTGMDPGTICFDNVGSQDITLTVTDGTTFDDTTITIIVDPLPTVTATAIPNDSICNGDQVTLVGGGAVSYSWDGGVSDGVPFIPTATATYTVTGTDANLCENDATITITVMDCIPLEAGFSYPDPVCKGNCLTLTDTSHGAPTSWSWDFGDAATPSTSTDQNPVVCFDTVGVFDIQLTVMDDFGQTSSTTNQITVFPQPVVTALADTTIDLGGEATLTAVDTINGLTYLWTENYYLDCNTCPITVARPQYDTMYVITVTDTNGCSAMDTVNVMVNFIEGIGVPSAFSPNGDGNNDVLFVKGIGITELNFSVYNRYGQKVFETQDQNIGWDGKFHGKDENQGVFLWILEYTFYNGSGGVKKGNTTLIR